MMADWYFSRDGKAEGPVDETRIFDLIKDGKIAAGDPVFHVGDEQWRRADELPKFAALAAEYAKATSPSIASRAESGAVWVILKRKEQGFDQSGPYPAESVLAMIAAGEVGYSDYTWRQGFAKWERLGDLEEFDRRHLHTLNPDIGSELTRVVSAPAKFDFEKTRVGSFDRLKREQVVPPLEKAPIEADDIDLLSEKTSVAPFIPPAKSFKSKAPRSAPPAASSAPAPAPAPKPDAAAHIDELTPPFEITASHAGAANEHSHVDEDGASDEANEGPEADADADAEVKHRHRRKQIMLVAGAAGLVVGVALAIGHWARSGGTDAAQMSGDNAEVAGTAQPPLPADAGSHAGSHALPPSTTAAGLPAAKIELARPAGDIAKPRAPDQPSAPPAAPEHAALQPMGKAATSLEIIGTDLQGAAPRLSLKTDAPVGSAISFVLKAKSGDILELPSFYRSAQIKRAGSDAPFIDLAAWQAPPGRYEAHAKIGELSRFQTIFVGVKDASFLAALERHHKLIALQQQIERKALFYGAKRLERIARSLADGAAKKQGDSLGWHAFYSEWKKDFAKAKDQVLAAVAPYKAHFAYRSELQELAQAAARLKKQALAYSAAIEQKRAVASVREPDSLEAEFARIKTQAAQLSSRRE